MWGRRLAIPAMLGIGLMTPPVPAQDRKEPPADAAPIEQAIEQLIEEATEAKANLRLAHDEPNFAERFDQEAPDEAVVTAILEPQHRDPFIDAYIRWQLTSFDPKLPEFDDRAFGRLLSRAPRMVNNPKADASMLNALDRAERAGRLPPQQIAQIRQTQETLNEREMKAQQMNKPAEAYRDWIAERIGDTGIYPRLWMLERLAAEIVAGWPVASTKSAISRNFLASITDETFTAEQRRAVIVEAQRLVGPGRTHLRGVTYLADGTIKVSHSTSKVTNGDIDNWRKRLNGIKPD